MTRTLAALACALLLTTAGCAGLDGSNAGTETVPMQTTVDATEVSTTATSYTTTESAEQLAPGVTETAVVNARALADAHRDALGAGFVKYSAATRENESTTAIWTRTFGFENESVWRLTTTGENTPVALDVTNGTMDQYGGGEYVLWRLDDADTGNTSYGVRSITIDGDGQPIPADKVFKNNYQSLYEHSLIYSLASNADSVKALDASEGAVELSGTAGNPSTEFTKTSDVEFTMSVADSGFVTAIDLAYESGDGTVQSTVTFDTDVTDPVEEPDWYGSALNETGLNESGP